LLREFACGGIPILFIDGIDKIDDPAIQLTVNDVIRSIAFDDALTHWKVVVTVREQNLKHLETWLDPDALNKLPLRTLTIGQLDDKEADIVATRFPRLRPLLHQRPKATVRNAMCPFSPMITIAAIAAVVAAGMSVPASTLTSAYDGFGQRLIDEAGIVDERAHWNPCTGIWSYFDRTDEQGPTYLGRPDNIHYWSCCYGPPDTFGARVPGGWPNAKDARTGRLLRTIGHGVYGSSTIGMLGYFAGPKIYIIDDMALADVLLARLPVAPALIRIGHFRRDLPQGYLETINTGQDHLTDPGIAACYEQRRLITSGDIWRTDRFAQIARYEVSRCQASNSHGAGWFRKN